MKITKIAQGYKPDTLDKRDNIFGSGETPAPIILPSGNWNDLFTPDEFQNRGFETYGCVTFSFLNATEKLAKLLFDEIWDKSERFSYIAGKTDPKSGGASPRVVADGIRHQGVLNEPELPFDTSITTLEQFNSPVPLTQALLDKAKPFLRDYEFRYDFMPTTNGEVTREMLRVGLYRSPICVAVMAWAEKNGKYYRMGDDTHLTLLTNVKDNNELEVFDSYSPSHKTLSSDFKIYTAIRVYLRKKTEEEKALEEKKQLWIIAAYRWVIAALQYIVDYKREEQNALKNLKTAPKPPEQPISPETPKNAPQPVVVPETMQEMATRVCKEEKLTDLMTQRLLATIQCESNFDNEVIHKNISKKTGKVLSTDFYLCQINDYYHIGEGKSFPSVQYVHDNPEKVVRWMARLFKQGKANLWVCYKNLYL